MKKHHMTKIGKPGAGGIPVCGARGIDRFKTVTVSAERWAELPEANRCARCAAKLTVVRS
jgi:hypothetical protein